MFGRGNCTSQNGLALWSILRLLWFQSCTDCDVQDSRGIRHIDTRRNQGKIPHNLGVIGSCFVMQGIIEQVPKHSWHHFLIKSWERFKMMSNHLHPMKHNHGGLEDHGSFLNGWFVGSMLIFQGVYIKEGGSKQAIAPLAMMEIWSPIDLKDFLLLNAGVMFFKRRSAVLYTLI